MGEAEDAAKKGDDSSQEEEKPDIKAQLDSLSNKVGELADIMKQHFAKDPPSPPPPPTKKEEDEEDDPEKPKDEEDGEMAKVKAEFAKLRKELEALKSGTNHENARGSPGGNGGSSKFDPSTFDWPSYMLGELGMERGLLRKDSDGKLHPSGAWEDVN